RAHALRHRDLFGRWRERDDGAALHHQGIVLMVRTVLYVFGGVLLGLVIHLVVILILPRIADNAAYTRIAAIDALNKTTLLALPAAGAPNPLHLDPDMSYALCKL